MIFAKLQPPNHEPQGRCQQRLVSECISKYPCQILLSVAPSSEPSVDPGIYDGIVVYSVCIVFECKGVTGKELRSIALLVFSIASF
jgi:hypothetical protein